MGALQYRALAAHFVIAARDPSCRCAAQSAYGGLWGAKKCVIWQRRVNGQSNHLCAETHAHRALTLHEEVKQQQRGFTEKFEGGVGVIF
jgi:hypothetical protein